MRSTSGSRPALWGQPARPEVPARPAWSPDGLARLHVTLQHLLGSRALGTPGELLAYSYDATGERHWPDLAVLPDTAGEVEQVLRAVAETGLPVIPRGAGTNLSGGVVPLMGGVIVSLTRMNRIVTIDEERLRMVAEPGVVNAAAQAALARRGLFFAPDPGSHRVSTLGGNVAENSGGPHCVKYGVTTQHVIRLTGFLADGQALTLDRPEVPGYLDWAGLVTGSEGTLMVLTELTVGLKPLPPETITMLATFRDPEVALEAVADVIRAGLEPSSLELLDEAAVELVERFVQAGYPRGAGAVLLLEWERWEDGEAGDDQAEALLLARGALSVARAADPLQAERLWIGRRSAYGALAQRSAHVWVQDVTVPRPALAGMLKDVVEIGRRHGLEVITVAHAGDGNLHPNIAYNPVDTDEVARMRAADREILQACVARDGSITGEHGVGIDKLESLALMYSPAELDMMARMKQVFDPGGRLNPWKAILVPTEVPPPPARGAARWVPHTEEDVQAAVREALSQHRPMAIRGSGRRAGPADGLVLAMRELHGAVRLDVDNQTVEVRAGTTLGELSDILAGTGLEWAVDGWDPEETVGGVVAGALPHARRWGSGPVRDNVLGVTAVDGRGYLLRLGRPTLKNVAGYDLTKLLVGSFGRLAVITRVILRLRPRRSLQWMRWEGDFEAQAARSRALYRRGPALRAVVMTPDGLVTAWTTAAPRDAGAPIADPRPEWGRLWRERGAHLVFAWDPNGPTRRPSGPWYLAWPDAGVVGAEARAVSDWPIRSGGGEMLVLPPVLNALAVGTKQAWDPDAIFRGD